MKFWKKNYSVCVECGVHFEPVMGYEARWGQWCKAHREKPMHRDMRKDRVVGWAEMNWEKLESQYLEDHKKREEAYLAAQQEQMGRMMGQGHISQYALAQMAAAQNSYWGYVPPKTI